MIPFLVALAAAASIASSACAATLIQGLGMFSSTALTSKYTAPNKSFFFSFELPDDFAFTAASPGTSLTAAATKFMYRLDGVEIPTTLQYIAFTNDGFFFVFTDLIELYLLGADIETSGVLATPTAGAYQVLFDNDFTPVGAGYVVATQVADAPAPAPEPGVWALLILGFAAVGSALRGRARLARPSWR